MQIGFIDSVSTCVGQSEDVFYHQRVDFMKNVTADGEDSMHVLYIFSIHYLHTYVLCSRLCVVHMYVCSAVGPAYIGHHIRQPTALVRRCVLPVKCVVSPSLCQRASEVSPG